MADQNHRGVVIEQILNRRQRGANPGIVGDLPVLHRHVEINPHQHPLAGYLRITDCLFLHDSTSVSDQQSAISNQLLFPIHKDSIVVGAHGVRPG
jgi:hypothetical protein